MNTKLLGYCMKTKAKFVFISKKVWWVTYMSQMKFKYMNKKNCNLIGFVVG